MGELNQIKLKMFAFTDTQHSATSIEIDSSTPFLAASDGDLSLLQKSLKHLNVPASITDTNGLTPLHSAASYNQLSIIRWLLTQSDVNINAKDNDGDTPLHHCDHSDAARILIEEGNVDVSIRNSDGKTALEMKLEELKELDVAMDGDDDDDDDDEEKVSLEELVAYLKTI